MLSPHQDELPNGGLVNVHGATVDPVGCSGCFGELF
ncbi:MAG: hypothetical protein RLZZ232_673, partial [Planctomycetota bacterium]